MRKLVKFNHYITKQYHKTGGEMTHDHYNGNIVSNANKSCTVSRRRTRCI